MSAGESLGTLIVEAGDAIDGLVEKLDAAMAAPQRVVIACAKGAAGALAGRLPERFGGLPILAMPAGREGVPVGGARVAFLPAQALYVPPAWDGVPADGLYLRPWPLEFPFAINQPMANAARVMGWVAPAA